MNDDFVPFELAVKLREKGFDERCDYTYYNNYRVRDEIYEKHPGLSDDGYEDLRKKYGGPYKDEEVYGYYIEPLKLYSRNSTIGINPMTKMKVATNELCSCPHIHQVLKWLRDTHKLFVSPCVITDYQDDFHRDTTYWSFIVVNIESGDYIYREYERVTEKRFDSYEQAALAGIEYVLDL